MTLAEIAIYRLSNQQLTGTKNKTAVETLEWFGAMQGQEYAQTKWGLGLRLPQLKDHDLEKDFSEGKILRTHLLRPTWHLVSANDIQWLLELTAPRVHAANSYMYRKLELDNNILKRCVDIIIGSLQGGKQRTRHELYEQLKKHKIDAQGHRLSYIMMYAELEKIICSGARNGKQFTYALLEERIKSTQSIKSIKREEALVKLTMRYFSSRSPATIKDYSTWSGLTLTDCRKGIEMVGNLLQKVTIQGIEYYFSNDTEPIRKMSNEIHLLPIYDEIIMGYKDREAFFMNQNSQKPKPALKYDCMILLGGQVIGTWKRTIKTTHIELNYDLFKPLTSDQKKVFENSISRFEEFNGLKVHLG